MGNCAEVTSAQSTPMPANKKAIDASAVVEAEQWRLEPHVCKACFARIVSRPLLADMREYRCTNCEACTQHTDASMSCSCGIKIRKRNGVGRHGGPMVDAGIRCIPNPERSPAFPAAYVASEVGATSKT